MPAQKSRLISRKKKSTAKSSLGRKPLADPKERVVVFIERSRIVNRGGMKSMQSHLYQQA